MAERSHSLIHRLPMGLVVALFLGTPGHAEAQADPDTVKLRNDCRLATQVLITGRPAPHREQALATIGRCGAEGASALAVLWEQDFTGRDELVQWVGATRRVPGSDIADRLLAILEDPAAALDKRLATIMVMVTWMDPYAVPRFEDLRDRGPDSSRMRHWRVDHALPMSGRESLGSGFADRFRSALESVANSDPVEELRAAAALTLRSQPFGKPEG